jgi:hypothetical protein
VVGTVSLTKVSNNRTRVALLNKSLTGEPLATGAEMQLIEFCLFFTHMLEANGSRLPADPQRDEENGSQSHVGSPLGPARFPQNSS